MHPTSISRSSLEKSSGVIASANSAEGREISSFFIKASMLFFLVAVGWPTATSAHSNGASHDPLAGTISILNAVTMLSADTAIAVGESGTILTTTDGGETWTLQDSGTDASLNGVAFADDTTAIAVGSAGMSHSLILRTTDGGKTWTIQDSGTQATLNGVAFADAKNGWAVGFPAILNTTDGGVT